MTVIKNDVKIRVETLLESGLAPMAISKRLNLNYETVKSFAHKFKLNRDLPPKIKVYTGYFQGRVTLAIKKFVEEYPTAKTWQIIEALELKCTPDALNKWLNQNNLSRKAGKRSILITYENKQKRMDFARLMLSKDDDYLRSIVFSDETMVKAYPNGEITYYRSPTVLPDIISRRVQQGGSGQMLWGCLSWHAYGPLVALEGIFDH